MLSRFLVSLFSRFPSRAHDAALHPPRKDPVNVPLGWGLGVDALDLRLVIAVDAEEAELDVDPRRLERWRDVLAAEGLLEQLRQHVEQPHPLLLALGLGARKRRVEHRLEAVDLVLQLAEDELDGVGLRPGEDRGGDRGEALAVPDARP